MCHSAPFCCSRVCRSSLLSLPPIFPHELASFLPVTALAVSARAIFRAKLWTFAGRVKELAAVLAIPNGFPFCHIEEQHQVTRLKELADNPCRLEALMIVKVWLDTFEPHCKGELEQFFRGLAQIIVGRRASKLGRGHIGVLAVYCDA